MQAFTIENDVLVGVVGPLSAVATTINLRAPEAPFRAPPAPLDAGRPGILTIVDRLNTPTAIEILTYAARTINGDGSITLTGAARGQQGTAARAWTSSASAYQAPTRDQLQQSALGAAISTVTDAASVRALIGAGTGNGTVTSVSASSPLSSTGGAAPTISIPAATAAVAGHMTTAQASKLDGIAAGAQVNVPTNLAVGGSGNARTITSSTGAAASLPLASASAAGLSSLEDKAKLDTVQAGAQPNVPTNLAIGGTSLAPTVTSSTGSAATLPIAASGVAGVTRLSDAAPAALGPASPGASGSSARADHVHPHGDQAGGTLHATATGAAAGFMSAADKSKLDAVSFAGTVGQLVFLNGSGGISTAASLSYDTGTNRIVAPGLHSLNQFELAVTSSVPGEAAALSTYQQVITGGIASWQWTVRSGSGDGLIRMRLLSGSTGPVISIGSGSFGPVWHHENLNPASFATLGSLAGTALAASGAAGSATTAARSDHVHPRPTPAEIGAAAASHTHTASQISDSTAAGRALLTAADAAAQRAAMSVESTTQLNARDTGNRERANHTGNQLASTIVDFSATARAQLEGALVAGTNVNLAYAGAGATRTITINVTGGGGGSASVGPAGAIQQSNGSGGFANSGVFVTGGGVLSASDMAFNTATGGATGFMRMAWDPDASGNFTYGASRSQITLQPNNPETAGQIRLEARNSSGAGTRWLDIEGDQAEPVFFNGSFRNMLHTGNVRTVGGQSLFGSGDIAGPTTALSIVSNSVAIDLALGSNFTLTVSANITSMTLVNPPAASVVRRIFIRVTRDSNGARTFTLPAGWTAAPHSAPGIFTDIVAAANRVTDIEAWTLDGVNWRFFIEPLQEGSGSTAGGFLSRFRSTADLVSSPVWSSSEVVAIGSSTPPTESRLFVFGGASGAHVDVRGRNDFADQAILDLQGNDFDTEFRSLFFRYAGANAVGTIAGFPAQNFAEITSVADNFIIRNILNQPIRFIVDGVEAMQVTKTGIVSTLPIAAPNVGGGLGGSVILEVSAGVPAGAFEHIQTFTAAGVTAASRISAALAGVDHTAENDPEMLVVSSLWGAPGTGQITVGITFAAPTSGPVVVNWSAM